MFGITDGFDVVIGNPPYVQLQKDGGRLGNLYASCNFDSFVRTGDIYCLFYEKANRLSRDGGHVCYITSNKWMRAAYGRNLRDYFIVHTQPIQLLDMGPDVFDATVDTNILLLQNVVPKNPATFKTATIKADFDKQTGNITEYMNDKGMSMEMPAKGEPWAILSPTELVLKRKIVAIGTPLKKWDIIIYRGIITGCNEAFLIDEAKRAELIARDPRSVEIIRPAAAWERHKTLPCETGETILVGNRSRSGHSKRISCCLQASRNHWKSDRINKDELKSQRAIQT